MPPKSAKKGQNKSTNVGEENYEDISSESDEESGKTKKKGDTGKPTKTRAKSSGIVSDEFTELKSSITSMTVTMNDRFDRQTSYIENELKKTNERVDIVEERLKMNEHESTAQEKKLIKFSNELLEKVENLQKQQMLKEIHDRKPNLLFYGLPMEKEEERNAALSERKLRNLFIRDLEMPENEVNKMLLKNVHRLPVYLPLSERDDRPPTLVAAFVQQKDRDEVLGLSYKLKGKKMSIRTDLPVSMKKKRGQLGAIAYKLREEKKHKTQIRVKGTDIYFYHKVNEQDEWKLYKD